MATSESETVKATSESASRSGSARTASASASAVSLLEQVKEMVDDRLGRFTTAFFSDNRSSTQAIAGKIDAISDALISGCDGDGLQSGDAASNLQMPRSRVEVLDRMRRGRPAVYAAVRQGASNVVFASPLQQRPAIEAAIKAIRAASSSS